MTTEAQLPADPAAEEALLGSILIDPACLNDVAALVQPADFHAEKRGWIMQAALDLHGSGTGLDFVTLCNVMEDRQQLAAVGGAAYLTGLLTAAPTAVHALDYAERVRKLAARRRLIAAAANIAQAAYDSEADESELYRTAAGALEGALRPLAQGEVLTQRELLDAWAGWQLERVAHADDPKLTLPWKALGFVRPLRAGTLSIVAATPGGGKTMFAECCGEAWARAGFQVLYFHYELSPQIMGDRQMARWSGLTMDELEVSPLTAAMQRAADTIRAWPGDTSFIHCDGWSMPRVAMKARQLVRQGRANVVIVDYLQKAPWREAVRGLTPAQMRGQDAEVLKSLAERERVPVLALSQLTREGAQSKRKTMAHLRDSGEIGEKANLVITLDCEVIETPRTFYGRIYEPGEFSPEVTARVDKQTLGRIGDAKLFADRPRFRFADIART